MVVLLMCRPEVILGPDQFTYQVCDSGTPPECDQAVVNVTVIASYFDVCGSAVQSRTYYLPFPENETQFRMVVESSAVSGIYNMTNNARSITSIKVPYPNTLIIYDHWEDGYEANITSPVQTSTLFGVMEVLLMEQHRDMQLILFLQADQLVLDNTFQYVNRNQTTIVYDGKDKIYSSADLAISKVTGDAGQRFPVQNLKTDVIDVVQVRYQFYYWIWRKY